MCLTTKVSWMKRLFLLSFTFIVVNNINAQYSETNPDFHKCWSPNLKSAYSPLGHPGLLKYDVKWYNIELEATDTNSFIKGYSQIYLECTKESIDTVVLELSSSLVVDSTLVNSQFNTFIFKNDLLFIPLSSPLNPGKKALITTYYSGTPTTNNIMDGVFSKNDPNTLMPVTYTLTEPFSAKLWFPCKQVLEDKADSVSVSIITNKSLKAGSNGLLKEVIALDNNKVKYVWKSNYPTAYYLISFAVSDYTEYNLYAHPANYEDSILVQNYIYNIPNHLENNKSNIDATADMLEYFSDIFTLYPFHNEKYGHCQAAFGGGMEHQTMTTIIDFRFFLVAHELAHQWFGDNVTCASWQDIWVNEGFASYSEYLATEKLLSPTDAKNWMENNNFRALQATDGSIYVPFEEINDENRIFSYELSYKKGAAILHMLRFELNNDELFFDILREYQTRFKDSVAVGDDFLNVVNELSGENFNYFFDQWYYGEGFPIYDINWTQENDSLYIYSKQTSSSAEFQFYKSSLEFVVNYSNKNDTIRVLQDETSEVFSVPIPGQVISLKFDPNLWLLKKISPNSNLNKQILPDNYFDYHPNPFNEEINISFNYPGRENVIELYSIDGKLIYKKTTRAGTEKINMRGKGNGAYIMVISNNGKRFHKKVLKVE